MEKNTYNTGQYVFKAGEKSDKVFLLMQGEVGIFLPTNETQKPNHRIEVNEIFGEMGVIEGKLRMADARCLSSATIMGLTKEEFEKKIENSEPFIRGLIRILSSRVRDLQKNK
jgi:CRP/FNR family cyclic AMP-dependent transcriptional regulator|tara:strand:- start:14 stop:352 length:339 start_codon:yes stop_codon:yes gene_type:complete